jgi:hypothetical protein
MWNVLRQRHPKEETGYFLSVLSGKPIRPRFLNTDHQQYYVHCKEDIPMDVDFMLTDSLEVIYFLSQNTRGILSCRHRL